MYLIFDQSKEYFSTTYIPSLVQIGSLEPLISILWKWQKMPLILIYTLSWQATIYINVSHFCHFHMLEIRGSQCPIGTKPCPLVVLTCCLKWPSIMKFGPVEPELWTIEYCVLATAGIPTYIWYMIYDDI